MEGEYGQVKSVNGQTPGEIATGEQVEQAAQEGPVTPLDRPEPQQESPAQPDPMPQPMTPGWSAKPPAETVTEAPASAPPVVKRVNMSFTGESQERPALKKRKKNPVPELPEEESKSFTG